MMMTEHEWEEAEKRDPTKTYVEPPIRPSYKWYMRGAAACFIGMWIVAFGLIAVIATAIPDDERSLTSAWEFVFPEGGDPR